MKSLLPLWGAALLSEAYKINNVGAISAISKHLNAGDLQRSYHTHRQPDSTSATLLDDVDDDKIGSLEINPQGLYSAPSKSIPETQNASVPLDALVEAYVDNSNLDKGAAKLAGDQSHSDSMKLWMVNETSSFVTSEQASTQNLNPKAGNDRNPPACQRNCDACNLARNMDATKADIMKKWFKGKWPQLDVKLQRSKKSGLNAATKYFFVTYGPPASGKGSVLTKTMQSEMKSAKLPVAIQKPIEVLVDDLIKAWPGYEDQHNKCGDKDGSQKLYWQMRGDPAHAEEARENGFTPGVVGIDLFGDTIQLEAARQGYNLQLEMTGRSVDKGWFQSFVGKKFRKENNYKVVVAYPYVYVKTLLQRAAERQERTGQEAAPDDEILSVSVKASVNLEAMMENVDTVFLWDNNGEYGRERLVLQWNTEENADNYADCAFAKQFVAIDPQAKQKAAIANKAEEVARANPTPETGKAARDARIEATDAEVTTNLQNWLKKYWGAPKSKNKQTKEVADRTTDCGELG